MDNLTTMTKAQLIKECDGLRRELCQVIGSLHQVPALRRELCQVIASYHGENDVDIAKERGWDCFENCTQVGGEWLVNEGKA